MAEKKISFSVTCSLLSQYLKEKRSFRELGMLDINATSTSQEPNEGIFQRPTTLNLLPGLDISAENQTDTEDVASVSGHETAPLTIFYGRKMMVYEKISADKAADLMNLAYKGSSIITTPSTLSINFSANNSDKIIASDIQMPIARRASLHRFLQKRKDRIIAKVPYQVNVSSKMGTEATNEDAGSWLSLGPRGAK